MWIEERAYLPFDEFSSCAIAWPHAFMRRTADDVCLVEACWDVRDDYARVSRRIMHVVLRPERNGISVENQSAANRALNSLRGGTDLHVLTFCREERHVVSASSWKTAGFGMVARFCLKAK